ncbi:MAG: tetratricopeptide repeat protein [Phycisphaerales bacterium]|nr:tetratricopeptide repeat protein [Phycisphaerales bacterium]
MLRSCTFCTLLVVCAIGCANTSRNDPIPRDPQRSQELTRRAAELIPTEPDKAEEMLREALRLDEFNGPAHNNLGVIALNRDDLYEAATRFDAARRLMPAQPDPRVNLGMVFERAGRIDDALDAYRSALDVQPGDMHAVQALTRCELRHTRANDDTRARLESIALNGTSQAWRTWAARERAIR